MSTCPFHSPPVRTARQPAAVPLPLDEPALYPAGRWLDGPLPAAVRALPWAQRQVLALTARWLGDVIAGPHPRRAGTMCPFVPEALRRGRIHIGVEPRNALPVAVLRERLQRWAEGWLAGLPDVAHGAPPLTTLLVAHPFEEPDAARSTPHAAVKAERFDFLEAGRMVGVFTVPWTPLPEQGARATWHNPMAVLALRHMVRGDDFFLHTSAAAMSLYRRRHPERAAT
jgi:hypothetical protein